MEDWKSEYFRKRRVALVSRIMLHRRIEANPDIIPIIWEKSRRDIFYWADNFLTLYEPRNLNAPYQPFYLFEKQREMVRWALELLQSSNGLGGEVGLIEKSRDIGATWVVFCVVILHKWLFVEGFRAGAGSQKMAYVDERNNPKSIFEKLRIAIKKLPTWMQPPGWDSKENSKIGVLLNPRNGSTIVGEGGERIGRGDRVTLFVVDEFAHIQRDQEVVKSLSATALVTIFLSSVNGTANEFFRLRHSGTVPVFIYDWKDDPRKDQAWHDKQVDKWGAAIVAQEVGRNYMVGDSAALIKPEWVRAAINFIDRHPQYKTKPHPRFAGLDVGLRRDKCILQPREGIAALPYLRLENMTTTQTAYKTNSYCQENGIFKLIFDATGCGEGVSGTLQELHPTYQVEQYHGASAPSNNRQYYYGKTGKDLFLNLRAETAYLLAERFRKTWEVVEGIRNHPLDQLISIPDDDKLIVQLSQPREEFSGGKRKLESKADMAARGVSSPDLFDALMLCFKEGIIFSGLC